MSTNFGCRRMKWWTRQLWRGTYYSRRQYFELCAMVSFPSAFFLCLCRCRSLQNSFLSLALQFLFAIIGLITLGGFLLSAKRTTCCCSPAIARTGTMSIFAPYNCRSMNMLFYYCFFWAADVQLLQSLRKQTLGTLHAQNNLKLIIELEWRKKTKAHIHQ